MSDPPPVRYDRAYVEERARRRAATEQFHSLPPEAQDEYRALWQAEVDRQALREDILRELRWASVLSGALLLLAITVIWDVPTLVTVPVSLVLGATVGWIWQAISAGRFLALATVCPAYVLLRALGPEQHPFQMFFGFVAVASLATGIGALREVSTGNPSPGLLRALRRVRASIGL